MAMISFLVPFIPKSSDSLNNKANRYIRNAMLREVNEITTLTLKVMHYDRFKLHSPVSVHYELNTKLDLDNCAYVEKGILDAVRRLGIIRDDNRYNVKYMTATYGKENGIRVTIQEEKL